MSSVRMSSRAVAATPLLAGLLTTSCFTLSVETRIAADGTLHRAVIGRADLHATAAKVAERFTPPWRTHVPDDGASMEATLDLGPGASLPRNESRLSITWRDRLLWTDYTYREDWSAVRLGRAAPTIAPRRPAMVLPLLRLLHEKNLAVIERRAREAIKVSVSVTMPGRVLATNATTHGDGALTWDFNFRAPATPFARSRVYHPARMMAMVAILALMAWAAARVWRWRATARTLLLALLAGTAASSCGPHADSRPQVIRPDIVIVVVDALRRDHLGCYGYPVATSPFLDSVAATGVRFDDAWCQAPSTYRSTASLLTSTLFPRRSTNRQYKPMPGFNGWVQQAHRFTPYLNQENVLLTEVIEAAGYDTLAIFTNPHHHPTSGFWQGLDHVKLLPSTSRRPYTQAAVVNQEFFDWYDHRTARGPYFAYLHYMDVHNPYRPPLSFIRRFVTAEGRDLYVNGKPEGAGVPTPADLRYMTELYDAAIRYVDSQLQELVGELRRRPRARDTVILFTSDHGDELMDHGGFGHGTTLEKELLRVPLLATSIPVAGSEPRFTPHAHAGLVRLLDVAPTVLELAGVPPPASFEGTSLVPWLDATRPRDPSSPASTAGIRDLYSITTPRWHFIWNGALGDTRLYANPVDPRGLHDVSAEQPEVVRQLRALAQAEATKNRASIHEDMLTPEPQEVQMQLEALGYAE